MFNEEYQKYLYYEIETKSYWIPQFSELKCTKQHCKPTSIMPKITLVLSSNQSSLNWNGINILCNFVWNSYSVEIKNKNRVEEKIIVLNIASIKLSDK